MYLQELFLDIKDINNEIEQTSDPALKFEYEEEKELLFNELEEHAQDALFILEAYFQDCKETNMPIVLEYYRAYRELDRARRFKVLSLE
jgi:hypothetical protein